MHSISVIIPCYNVEAYIEECLRSVMSQRYKALEIICIDDCSSDRTVKIIKKLQAEFNGRIQLLLNDKNKGATYSRNRGLILAKGEYIQFLDADDLLLENKFEHQIKLITESSFQPDIIVGGCIRKYVTKTERKLEFQEQDNWCALLEAQLGVTTTNLFRREKLINIKGWSEEQASSQEYELMFRLLQENAEVLYNTETVAIKRDRKIGSITHGDLAANWKRFIQLRTRILNYLHNAGLLNDERKQTYINIVFDALRVLYHYDKEAAADLHHKYVIRVGLPSVSTSTSGRYLKLYKLFGFNATQAFTEMLRVSIKPGLLQQK